MGESGVAGGDVGGVFIVIIGRRWQLRNRLRATLEDISTDACNEGAWRSTIATKENAGNFGATRNRSPANFHARKITTKGERRTHNLLGELLAVRHKLLHNKRLPLEHVLSKQLCNVVCLDFQVRHARCDRSQVAPASVSTDPAIIAGMSTGEPWREQLNVFEGMQITRAHM
jgi:hypothetical protein